MNDLPNHIQRQQNAALKLERIVNAALCMADDKDLAHLNIGLLEAASEIARQLNQELDSVNLPKGGAA
ncbi:hypothetical protein [Paracoccus marinaquae]|uniref:Histidine kinase n=1 Tax=Paracoccus marinaquae TaxID=2841926 RepID=A0ABS6AP72_9RHOB|nr:hypothetical protein [Paracoccus marinaquae]MBU3032399.1 hypothetical protein [Paracoccus marinaquae]